MIKDTGGRLEKATQELKTLIVGLPFHSMTSHASYRKPQDSVKARPEFTEDEELLEAEKLFTEASG